MSWQSEAWIVDVSHHQGLIDFEALAKAGCVGAFIKASEGRTHEDPRFRENWDRSRALRFRAAYHFARIDTDTADPNDAHAEAQHFARVVGSMHGEGVIMPWLDSEYFGSLGANVPDNVNRNLDWSEQWIETCEAELGRSPGIYTGADVWSARWGRSDRFAHLALWQADHASEAGLPEPMHVGSWRPFVHQFTARAVVPGIKTRVDANVVCCSAASPDPRTRRAQQLTELEGLTKLRLIPRLEPPKPVVVTLELPVVDLGKLPSNERDEVVARVQALLVGHRWNPIGLIDAKTLRPDGKPGAKTRAALVGFKLAAGLDESTVVDGETWRRLHLLSDDALTRALEQL